MQSATYRQRLRSMNVRRSRHWGQGTISKNHIPEVNLENHIIRKRHHLNSLRSQLLRHSLDNA
jgi:hypothetical protein